MAMLSKFYGPDELKADLPLKVVKFLTKLKLIDPVENVGAAVGKTMLGSIYEALVKRSIISCVNTMPCI